MMSSEREHTICRHLNGLWGMSAYFQIHILKHFVVSEIYNGFCTNANGLSLVETNEYVTRKATCVFLYSICIFFKKI